MSFDLIIPREGSHCEKFDSKIEKFGTNDLFPLWVADMDFASSKAIQEAINKRAKHPIYGYTSFHESYFASIKYWMNKQHQWKISNRDIVPVNGIVPSLNLAVEQFTQKGDGVIIQTPIYPPFMNAIKHQSREILENQLQLINGRYEINFVDFREKAKRAKLFLFCSPHNPTGRVWQQEELEEIIKICNEYKVLIISDEVHSDLIYREYKHTPIATLKNAKDITITLNAPSKTFNVAGVVNAYAIVPNSSLKRRFETIFKKYALINPNPFSIEITIAAYKQSGLWLDQLQNYLEGNLNYLIHELEQTPKIKPIKGEATFLLWLDCRELNLNDHALSNWFINEAKLGLNSGISFGAIGSGFMRINFALPRIVLKLAVKNLKDAYVRREKKLKEKSIEFPFLKKTP